MKLVIAEKPSVAHSIAAVIDATEKKDGYLQGNDYFVSWCIGHLVELAPADVYHEKYAKWRREDLPIFPILWQYQVQKGKDTQLGVLQKLMNDKDVDTVVCATDAGREGELIFRLVYEYCSCTKPVQRLWISSMEDEAIRQGMASMKDGAAYDRLYHSALCRAQADWLVGINATRLFSIIYGQTLNVGRVMTPTLALIVQKEQDVQAFEREPYYMPEINCGGFTASGIRQKEKEKASDIRANCDGQAAMVQNVEKQQKAASPPKLYDLTSLQRDANRLYGYTAQQTLDYLQLLYEKKLVTYPRTDSQYLTSDMIDTAQQIALAMTGILPFMQGVSFSPDIRLVLDSSKVTDHHAIIPTLRSVKKDIEDLTVTEKAVWMLVANRLLCATADRHEYETVTVSLDCAGFSFTAKGKSIRHDGWKRIDRAFLATLKEKPKAEQDETALPELQEGQVLDSVTASVKEGETSPPKRYTEDTLLSAMETAGAADAPDDAERKGLGTPATRASTIEKLVHTGFVERKKKNLMPTEKGMKLITVLPDVIKSPTLTAEWETMLKRVEHGEMDAEVFMGGIRGLLESLMVNAQASDAYRYLFPTEDKREAIGVCPRCGQQVREGRKGFFCENRECGFALWKQNKFFDSKKKTLNKKTAVTLLKEGRVFMSGLYSEKTGKNYDAFVLLDDPGGKYVNFKLEFSSRERGNP